MARARVAQQVTKAAERWTLKNPEIYFHPSVRFEWEDQNNRPLPVQASVTRAINGTHFDQNTGKCTAVAPDVVSDIREICSLAYPHERWPAMDILLNRKHNRFLPSKAAARRKTGDHICRNCGDHTIRPQVFVKWALCAQCHAVRTARSPERWFVPAARLRSRLEKHRCTKSAALVAQVERRASRNALWDIAQNDPRDPLACIEKSQGADFYVAAYSNKSQKFIEDCIEGGKLMATKRGKDSGLADIVAHRGMLAATGRTKLPEKRINNRWCARIEDKIPHDDIMYICTDTCIADTSALRVANMVMSGKRSVLFVEYPREARTPQPPVQQKNACTEPRITWHILCDIMERNEKAVIATHDTQQVVHEVEKIARMYKAASNAKITVDRVTRMNYDSYPLDIQDSIRKNCPRTPHFEQSDTDTHTFCAAAARLRDTRIIV